MTKPNHDYDSRIIGGLNIFYRGGTCDEIIFHDEYQKSRFFIPEYKPEEDHIILDIGAHIGVFSLLIAERVKKGRVYAIEADEENYHCLRTNVESNGLSNINTFLIALTDYKGTGKLYLANDNWGHTLCGSESGNWNMVPTDTLANIMIDNNIHHVDYMKMNVEGAEYSILLSTPKNIIKSIKIMLIEFHPSQNQEYKLIQYLEQCGFSVKIGYSVTEKGKGWIIAKLEEA